MPEAVAIIGAGGHAKVLIGLLESLGREVAAAYDDDPAKHGRRLLDVPIVGGLAAFRKDLGPAVVGVGDNAARKRIVSQLDAPWVTLVHATAWVHRSSSLGPGTVVMAGAVVQPDVRIGNHCIVNSGATIDHDCVLGDFAHAAPGANLSGTTTIGEGTLMGTGSATRQNISIGAWSTVGVGAAVVDSLPDHCTAVGVPARVIKVHQASKGRTA